MTQIEIHPSLTKQQLKGEKQKLSLLISAQQLRDRSMYLAGDCYGTPTRNTPKSHPHLELQTEQTKTFFANQPTRQPWRNS